MSRTWTWRHAVAESDLSAPVKHVLLTLSLKMNDLGEGCWPTIEELVRLCSRTPQWVCDQLKKAEKDGWIERQLKGEKGQSWARTEYLPVWPEAASNQGEACAVRSENMAENGDIPQGAEGTKKNRVPSSEGGGTLEKNESEQGTKKTRVPSQKGTKKTRVPSQKGTKKTLVRSYIHSNKESPQPPEGAVEDIFFDFEKSLQNFKSIYPCKSSRPEALSDTWGILNPEQRQKATIGASGYVAHNRKNNRSRPQDPAKFVMKPALWDEMASEAPAQQPKKIFVERGTKAWAGLCVLNAVCHGQERYLPRLAPAGCIQAEGRTGTLVSDQLDLARMESLAGCADEFGEPDFEVWHLCVEKTKQWWAWNDRAKRCGYEPLEASPHETGKTYEQTLLGGRVETFQERISGVLVPSEWPPRLTSDDGEADDNDDEDAGVDETDNLGAEATVDA